MVTIFVEGDKAGHRHRCHLKAEEEQQEVVGTHHHVHSQEGGDDQFVELSLLEIGVLTKQPLARLNHHDERAEGKDGLDDPHAVVGHIHATKGGDGGGGRDIDQDMGQQQQSHHRVEPLARTILAFLGCGEQVDKEDNDQDGHERDLRNHVEKLTIIDIHN